MKEITKIKETGTEIETETGAETARIMDFKKSKKSVFNPQLGYTFLKYFAYFCGGLAVFALIFIIAFIVIRGAPHLTFNLIFGEYTADNPTIGPAAVGTLWLVGIAILIAAPIGICTAVFLTEYTRKGKLVRLIRLAAETLAAIPSVVYGLFGFAFFYLALNWGYSLLSGGIAVSLMIMPTIIRASEEAILAVPIEYREASYALGSSKVRTIFKVVLPSASGGIITSVILAIGRVISESAVFLFTIGVAFSIMPKNPMSWGGNLALFVYQTSIHGHPEQAAAGGVVLIALVLLLNLAATLLKKFLTRGQK